jgi:hypothetical protein
MSMVTAPPTSPLTWTELGDLVNSQSAIFPMDLVNGPTNAQTKLRLFG